MNTDVLIVGSGCSGLYCALKLPRDIRITLITKSDLESNDSFLAQGGMCMLKEQSDFDSFFEDTLKAGHYENDRESVGIMINSSPEVVKDLVSYGADFARNDDGNGIVRGELTQKIIKVLAKRDNNYQKRWDKIWSDMSLLKFKRDEFDDYWLWNHEFYNAKIEDLKYIYNKIK